MTARVGIATTASGGVKIVTPMLDCIRALKRGGAISQALTWRDGMREWLSREFEVPDEILDRWGAQGVSLEIAMSWEAHKFVSCPDWRSDLAPERRTALAWLWVRSLAFGGLSERAAIELICVVSAGNDAVDLVVVDAAEIPQDRSNRDNWWRGHNGGPIFTETRTQ